MMVWDLGPRWSTPRRVTMGVEIMRGHAMKKSLSPNGRRHGLRARQNYIGRITKTVLTFESDAQIYTWTTDRPKVRAVLKH